MVNKMLIIIPSHARWNYIYNNDCMTVTESVSTLEVIDLSSSVITLLTNCGVVLNLNTILLPSIHLRQQYILTRE